MNELVVEVPTGWRQLDNLPIGLFGSVMGLTGLSAAWHLAHVHYGAPAWIAHAIAAAAVIVFVVLALAYGVKMAVAPKAVLAEFRHPIAGSLFGTFFISLLLLPILLAPYSLLLARMLWLAGAVGMLTFAWLIVSRWFSSRQQFAHATPAWIVPVVGLLDMPLAVPVLAVSPAFSDTIKFMVLLAVAVGLFFAIVLFTLIFSRLLFEEPMPDALRPTLLILVAPFAVGSSSYTIAVGANDLFAQALYMLMLFVLATVLPRIRYLPLCCPFRFSWWAVSFPLAASAITALHFAMSHPGWLAQVIAIALLALATVTIAGLLVRTLTGLFRGELRELIG